MSSKDPSVSLSMLIEGGPSRIKLVDVIQGNV